MTRVLGEGSARPVPAPVRRTGASVVVDDIDGDRADETVASITTPGGAAVAD